MPTASRSGLTRRQVLAAGSAALALSAGATAALLHGSGAWSLRRLGFGARSRGGQGGPVVVVTSLEDDGAGTLREALEQTQGPRIVRFDVSGTIRLSRQIRVIHPGVTLDGTTAPGNGVTVSGARLRIETHDVVITGMQLRPGDDTGGDTPNHRDALSLGDGARNVLVVGNSLTWALDENVSLWGSVRNVTLAYNIVGEGLRDSIHIDEDATEPAPHSMGMVIGSGNPDAVPSRITIARNLFVSNAYRNPYLQTGRAVEVVCNLVVNYGAGHQAMSVGNGSFPCVASVRGNVFWAGNDTRVDPRPPVDLRGLPEDGTTFLGRNSAYSCNEPACAPETSVGHGRIDLLSARPSFMATTAGDLALASVPDHVLDRVGARDINGTLRAVDAKLIRAVQMGQSRIIDRPTDSVGLA